MLFLDLFLTVFLAAVAALLVVALGLAVAAAALLYRASNNRGAVHAFKRPVDDAIAAMGASAAAGAAAVRDTELEVIKSLRGEPQARPDGGGRGEGIPPRARRCSFCSWIRDRFSTGRR